MKSNLPKALLPIAGEPALVRSLHALREGGVGACVVLVRAEDEAQMIEACAATALPLPQLRFAYGGTRRQDSVAAGLAVIASTQGDDHPEVVLVHDAARPLVPPSVVAQVIDEVNRGALSVVPVVAVADTIRQRATAPSAPNDPGALTTDSKLLDRGRLVAVQTPQGFSYEVIVRAHAALADRGIEVTDDAAACELIGVSPRLVAGSRRSLKLTEAIDLLVAEAWLASEGSPARPADPHAGPVGPPAVSADLPLESRP